MRRECFQSIAIETKSSTLFCGIASVAIQRGVLVKSDSTYYRQIEESIGLDSTWTRYHRIGAGVDAGSTDVPPVVARGIATLHLYQETARLLWSILEPPQREVIGQTVKVIEKARLL
jgi:hypothetical protein